MRVTIIGKDDGILSDGTSLDNNEGSVVLEFEDLKPGVEYTIRYDLYDKELISNNEIAENTFTSSNTYCKLPFITQQLIIMDKGLLKHRVLQYNQKQDRNAIPITSGIECDFGRFNNTIDSEYGEDGLFCDPKIYTYQASAQTNQELLKLYEHPFQVRGVKNELITYWYEMVIGINFMVSSGMKIILSRNDHEYDTANPLSCLYDKSCVEASLSAKNLLKIEVILTSGLYKLSFFEQESSDMRRLISEEAGLENKPFSLKVTSYPVLQNEERVNCPYMFMDSNFIQSKFIEGMNGQRFSYQDKIIMNIFNLTQRIDFAPEADSILKIKVKEAFGVNAGIVLCQGEDCLTSSIQIGTTEVLIGQVKKGLKYYIELHYANSIITYSDFFDCPHINIEISMIQNTEAETMVSQSQCSSTEDFKSDEALNSVFNGVMENKDGHIFVDYTTIFTQLVDQSQVFEPTSNFLIGAKRFVAFKKMELFVEVFYEAYLYDIEMTLVSVDADKVRSHIYKPQERVNWSLLKGSKSIFVELEPGEYEVQFTQKLPQSDQNLQAYKVKCVKFQLQLIYAPIIDRQQIIPVTLNYFGLLGPEGKDFGQVTYYCQECFIENIQYKHINFFVNDDNQDINFDAMISSASNSIDIFLESVSETESKKNDVRYDDAFTKEIKKGKKIGNKKVVDKGKAMEKEEIITAQKLSSSQKYRVVVQVKNTDDIDQKNSFNLRLELQEWPKKQPKKQLKEILPQSIDEVMRQKLKTEGLKESDILIGTKFMLKWLDELKLTPFQRKSQKVYQTYLKNKKGDEFEHRLKFEVQEEEAQIYAAIFDYSGYAGLGLTIIKDDDEDDWEMVSLPGKYFSYIPPITLTNGTYYLVISSQTKFAYEDADFVRFGLDMYYERENVTDYGANVMLNTMELCGIPGVPYYLNGPEYIHPLSGNSLQTFFKTKMSEIILGESIQFEIKENSLVNIYLEFSNKEVKAEAELSKTKGTNKLLVSSEDLNSNMDNFLKVHGFAHDSVIQFREFLNPGNYMLKIRGIDSESEITFATSRCDSVNFGLQVTPLATAKNKIHEKCIDSTIIGNKLNFGKVKSGNLSYSLSHNIIDTSYIKTEDQGEGPFLFYFQANYDSRLEGALALALYKYDKDSLSFDEVQLFSVQDSQTSMIGIIEEGTYVIMLESMTSTQAKYINALGKGPNKNNINLVSDPCNEVTYSYYISTSIENDAQEFELNFFDFLASLFMDGNAFDNSKQLELDKNLRKEFQDVLSKSCKYDELQRLYPATETGYDYQFMVPFSRKSFELLDIVNEELSLFKVFFYTQNPKNNLNAFLYQKGDFKNVLAQTKPSYDEKILFILLAPQQKAYKLKIIYDSLDENDQCPVYDFRIALKPIQLVLDENLACGKQGMPPEKIKVNKTMFGIDGEYQISNEFLEKYMTDNKELTYDIEIQVPDKTKTYYFDIETRFDFLTADIDLTLFVKDQKTSEYIFIADDLWLNEVDEDNNKEADTNKSGIKRLKVDQIKDMMSEDQAISDTYILRLRYSKYMKALISTLKSKSLLKNEICFTFDLSIRVSEAVHEEDSYEPFTDPDENEIVRIDWSHKLKDQRFDPRQKLSVFIQFKESMKEQYKTLKFTPFVWLEPKKFNPETPEFDQKIYPFNTRLSVIDKSIIVITFQHGSLPNGECYKLNFDQDQLIMRYDPTSFEGSNEICTTNCQCNVKGMKTCNEKKGTCVCHKPYTGSDCRKCIDGYIFNEETEECQPASKCKENGGTVDCNGHGTCFEDDMTGQARCECQQGFQDDGLDFCSKCSDPLFTYPDCFARYWIVEPTDYNCENLPTIMPLYLYRNESQPVQNNFQNEEGQAHWNSIYKLQGERFRKSSFHYFQVPKMSVFRMYIDTHKSGVKVKYSILDDKKEVVYTTPLGEDSSFITNDIVMKILKKSSVTNAPFTLHLQYEYDQDYIKKENKCPMLEIQVIVQPFLKMKNYLKCSTDELEQAKQTKQFEWNFDYRSFFFNENFTLTSDMRPNVANSYFHDENEQFYIMKYRLNVQQPGNALSIITSYSFESVALSLTLRDRATENVIAVEKYESLEDYQGDTEDSMFSLDNDMVSYIEIPSVDAGDYDLEILVRKFLFLPSKKDKTCLNFDLFIEYVSRTQGAESEQYEVISVMPTKMKGLTKVKKNKIDVKFNRDLDVDEIMGDYNGLHHLCYLENKQSETNVINPYKVLAQKDTLSLFFNYKDAEIQDSQLCYKLKCTTKFTIDKEVFEPIVIKTDYCFAKTEEQNHTAKCNPNALPKVVNNKCVCTYPYKGPLCEDCENGYKNKKNGHHSVCVIDEDFCTNDICSGHGDCSQRSNGIVCQCYDKWTGKFCDKCKDPTFAYPDCDEITSDIYDEVSDKEYLDRRKYNEAGYEKSKKDKSLVNKNKPDQCGLVNFPKSLDKIEFMGFLKEEFHIAEYYTINHDQDNFIKFTPKKQGTIKILVQQPELEELAVNDEGFDLEIAIYDIENDKYLATAMNHYLNFEQKTISGKLDYAQLEFIVPYQQVNKTLYILFRAVNFTESEDEGIDAKCEDVYIEIEFKESQRKCDYSEQLFSEDTMIQVRADKPYNSKSEANYHSVYTQEQTFFYTKDFYFGDENEETENDYELKVAILQKFIEKNMVDFIVEVLADDVDYEEAKSVKKAGARPTCEKICITGGQKAYNEFHNVIQVSARTALRLWLYQTNPGSCANFQLLVDANKINQMSSRIQNLNELKCEELDLPNSLNNYRYLGDKKAQQQNFHYLERFRVDNLKNNTSHRVNFEISEPTMVRFVASIHKHIEFDLELRHVNEENGVLKSRKLIDSGAKGFEDSILAQLKPGRYYLKLIFVSEEFFLSQPCQAITMELAFSTIASLNQKLSQKQSKGTSTINFPDLLKNYNATHNFYQTNAVKSFVMSDPNVIQTYMSYTEIFSKRFSISKLKNIGIYIEVKSDFMLNDVNFALTNLNNNKIFQHTRTENSNKLVLESLPGGDYEFLIYAHNCLSNIEDSYDMIKSLDAQFEVDIHFIKWTIADNFIKHFLMVDIDKKGMKVPLESFDKNEYQCVVEYNNLPAVLASYNYERIDVNGYYQIPIIEEYEHVMEYVPEKGQDSLRVVVERPNTKIKLFEGKSENSLFDSFATNLGQQQVLIATGLRSGSKYRIEFEFDLNENYQEFEEEICQNFKLQILSSKASEQCAESDNYEEVGSALTIKHKEDKTLSLNVKATPYTQRLKIADNATDLIITIDYSKLFYIPSIKFGKIALDAKNQDARKQLSKEIKPTEIDTSIKNMITYKFSELNQDEYSIIISQYKKPKACLNVLKMEITAKKSNDLQLEGLTMGMIKTYTSQEEIQNLNRYVQKLPISLNTFKYLRDEDYLFISEYLALDIDQDSNNKITFNIDKDETLFRIYVENDEIYMTLKDVSRDKVIINYRTQSLVQKLSKGKYEIMFEFSTEIAKLKASLFKNTFRLTVAIFDKQFAFERYIQPQGKALKNCDNNVNFPLALNKKPNINRKSKELTYSYPNLRLSGKVLLDRYVVDTYAFRINETTRFYFEIGMHILTNHVILRLTELKDYGNSYVGKQEFNLNILDIIVGPGDYSLEIEQPSILNWDFDGYDPMDWMSANQTATQASNGTKINVCGIFSLYGKETPLSELGESKSGHMAQSRCEIKEVLPTKIYKSLTDTKNGLEFYINQDGNFNHVFENVLIKKSRNSQLIPNFDRIEIVAQADGMFGITVQYKQKNNQLLVKVLDALSWVDTEYKPFHSYSTESANNMIEETFLFKMQKNKAYFVMIYYKGEITFDYNSLQEVCDYYNAYLSFDTNKRMRDELTCMDQKTKDSSAVKVLNFVNDIPSTIQDRDFKNNEYKFQGYAELKYPEDYKKLSDSENEDLMTKMIELKLNDQFDIASQIKFDFPFSLFEFSLFDQIKNDDGSFELEEAATQLPVEVEKGDEYVPTLIRALRSNELKSSNKYSFVISDQISWHILDALYRNDPSKGQLCLYSEISITISKKLSASQLAAQAPMILAAYPSMEKGKAYKINENKKELLFSLHFSTPPFMKGSSNIQNLEAKISSFQELSYLVTLQFKNPESRDMIYQKRPIRIQSDPKYQYLTFAFSVEEEQSLKEPDFLLELNVDLPNLVDRQGRSFSIKDGVYLPRFRFVIKELEVKKAEKEAKSVSKTDKIKRDVSGDQKQALKPEEVKCNCVHGQCRTGESECYKCDEGWTGKRCDIKQKAENINKKEGDKKGQVKTDGSRMNRDRDDQVKKPTETKPVQQSTTKPVINLNTETDRIPFTDSQKLRQPQEVMDIEETEGGIISYLLKITGDLILVFIVLALIGVAGYALLKKTNIKEYLPVPQNERDDHDQGSPAGAMELSDLRKPSSTDKQGNKRKNLPSRDDRKKEDSKREQEPLNLEQEDIDDDTQRLTNELHLYAYGNEQDAAMLRENQQQQIQHEQMNVQPQHFNEEQTSHEIENALRDMNDFDDDDDDNMEMRRFV